MGGQVLGGRMRSPKWGAAGEGAALSRQKAAGVGMQLTQETQHVADPNFHVGQGEGRSSERPCLLDTGDR